MTEFRGVPQFVALYAWSSLDLRRFPVTPDIGNWQSDLSLVPIRRF
jgi:hypothetical protein